MKQKKILFASSKIMIENKVEMIGIDLLIPAPWNPRLIKDEKFKNLCKSIENDPEFMSLRPILCTKDKVIYAGNMRYRACKHLGWQEIPCIVTDISEIKAKERAVKDNNQFGEWDDTLSTLLDELEKEGVDLETLGLNDQVEEMIEKLNEKEIVEDEVPELKKDPQTKLGDLWQLGEHRLLCGDATKLEDVEKLMDGQKADMVFTDPPYGVSFQSNMRTKSEKFDILENDDTILTDWIAPVATSSQGWVFVWTTWKVLDKWLPVIDQFGKMSNMIIWHKGGGGMGDLKHSFSTDYEIALVFSRGREVQGKRIGSVWALNKDFAGNYQHPTQKPVALAAEAIQKTSKQGERVLDVFGGSGSTLIACEQLNRKCYMMELDPQYVRVIIDRWEKLTGEKAKLL